MENLKVMFREYLDSIYEWEDMCFLEQVIQYASNHKSVLIDDAEDFFSKNSKILLMMKA